MKKTAKPTDTVASAVSASKTPRRRPSPPKPRAAENRLSGIIENTQAGYFFIDRKGIFRSVNKAWLDMHGYDSPAEVLGKHFSLTQADTDLDAANRMVAEILAGKPVPNGEFARRRKDGSIGCHTFSASPVISGGKVTGIEGFLIDTTDRKRVDEELLRSKTFLEQSFEQSPTPMVLLEMPGAILKIVNSAYRRMLGTSDEPSRIGQSLLDIPLSFQYYQPDGRPVGVRDLPIARAIAGERIDSRELRIVRKDQTELWVLAGAAPILDSSGKIIAAYLTLTDITAHRQAEAALQTSEEKYRLLFDKMLDGFALHEIICDNGGRPVDYRFLAINPAFEKMTGLKAQDIVGRTIREALPGTEKYWIDIYGNVALTGEPAFFENYSGALNMHFAVTAFRPAPGQFACIFADITEYKNAQGELRKERDLLSSIAETSPVGITVVDREGKIVFANRGAEKILGLTCNGITSLTYKSPDWRITAEDGTSFPEADLPFVRVMTEGRPVFGVRHAIVWPDGKKVFLSINAAPLLNAAGCIEGIVSCLEDITERRKAEEALRESEVQYRTLVEGLPDFIMRFDHEGRHLFVSDNVDGWAGLKAARFIGKTHRELGFPEKLCSFWEAAIFRVFETGVPLETEFTFDGPKSSIIYNWRLLPELDDDWKVRSVLSISRDISERSRAEAAIRESEEKFSVAFQTAPVLFAITDLETGVYADVNDETLRVTGFQRDEIIGRQAVDIGWLAQGDRDRMMSELITNKRIAPTEIKFRSKDGHTVIGQISGDIIRIAGKNLLLTVTVDVTARRAAEEALRESEEKFFLAFQKAPMLMSLTNLEDGRILDVNEEFTRLSGFSRSDAIGKTTVELGWIALEDRQRVIRTFETQGSVSGLELTVTARDGQKINCLLFAEVINIGADRRMLTLAQDITERKRAEAAIRDSEEKFARAFQKAPMLMIISSLEDGKIVDINEEVTRLSGYTRDEAIGKTTAQLGWIRPPEREWLIDRLIKTGTVEAEEISAIAKDGSRIHCMAYRETITIGGRPCLLTLAQDIAQRKKAEQEINRVYQLNKSIIASVTEGIIIYDRQFRYQMWNPFMEKLTGIPEADLLGKRIGEYHTPLKHYELEEVLQRVLDGETLHFPAFPYDIPFNGRKGWAEASCTQQRDEDGSVVGVIVSIRDVTDKHQMQERLLRAEKMEALGLLAGGVAHDLNNVLGISLGYSEMLLDDIEPASPFRPHISNILKATEKATAIVQDLLTMARRGVAVSKVLSLNTIAADLLGSAELSALLALHPHVEVRSSLAPDLLNISGSPVHLAKTIMNLFSNAAEAISNHGTISITTQNIHLDHPVKGYDSFTEGDYAVLCVSDTGEGISAENLPRIFEPFYTKKVMGRSGTGLGLAVVWGTVKDHQGYIDVASNPGQGTVFSLYFPVVRADVGETAANSQRTAYMGKGETLLVVDDNDQQRELAMTLLNKLNYRVAAVAGGEDAVEFLKKTPVDLVILDMIMDPGIDGLETYRRLLAVRPGQKAIIVSGFAETDRVTEAQRLGAGAYVKKPYVLENLGTAVRQELDKKG